MFHIHDYLWKKSLKNLLYWWFIVTYEENCTYQFFHSPAHFLLDFYGEDFLGDNTSYAPFLVLFWDDFCGLFKAFPEELSAFSPPEKPWCTSFVGDCCFVCDRCLLEDCLFEADFLTGLTTSSVSSISSSSFWGCEMLSFLSLFWFCYDDLYYGDSGFIFYKSSIVWTWFSSCISCSSLESSIGSFKSCCSCKLDWSCWINTGELFCNWRRSYCCWFRSRTSFLSRPVVWPRFGPRSWNWSIVLLNLPFWPAELIIWMFSGLRLLIFLTMSWWLSE